MEIQVVYNTLADSRVSAQRLADDLASRLRGAPDYLVLYLTEGYDAELFLETLATRFPQAAIQGGTSCLGVMTADGFHSEDGRGAGILAIHDPQGAYGVGAEAMDHDPQVAASTAVLNALQQANRPGEVPELVWLVGPPGREESILQGIAEVLGPNVPVAGGSVADNQVAGRWSQMAGTRVFEDAVTVAVLFPSTSITYAFHSGYSPTDTRGRITKASGRTILEIDGKPAAEVYNRWTGGVIEAALTTGGKILGDTTLFPLGRQVGEVEQLPFFRLSHPEGVTPEKGLTLFSDVQEGEELVLMTGNTETLLSRAGRVAGAALKAGEWSQNDIAGALVIYCAGCMLTVVPEMHQVAEGLRNALRDAPFLGTFTFGEQGCFKEGSNYHGNLMISVVLFHC